MARAQLATRTPARAPINLRRISIATPKQQLRDVVAAFILYGTNEARRLRLLATPDMSEADCLMIEATAARLEALCDRGAAALVRSNGRTRGEA